MKVTGDDLRASYADKTDEELRALASRRAFLTADGCNALELEMEHRGLDFSPAGRKIADDETLEPNLRSVQNVLAALFWAGLISPATPMLICLAGFHALEFWFNHPGRHKSLMAFTWSMRGVEAIAVLSWIYAIKLGFKRLRKITRARAPTAW